MTHRTLRPTLVFASVLCALCTLAACGNSASTQNAGRTSTSEGNTTSATNATSKGGASGSVSDGLGHPVTICDLLPVATVASIAGENLTVAKEDDTPSYKTYDCDYTNAAGTRGVTVSVLALDAAAGFQGSVDAAGSKAKTISGLGDKAFSDITGVQALFGNVEISVSDLQSDDAAVKLIRILQPKL